MFKLIDKIAEEKKATKEELLLLINNHSPENYEYLAKKARKVRESIYGKKIFIRGLIEISSYCKNDCYYCGLRRSNSCAERYRLTKEEILACCDEGYPLGFRTFVMQGGEDAYFTDEVLTDIVSSIKKKYPDCAVTLSVGERSMDSYKKLKEAGADRFLLRHETANCEHYAKLHPKEMTLQNRMNCLASLKKLGFQTGCGFMVGSPYQTLQNIVDDILFISEFKPEMIGIGPFIPHEKTPFKDEPAGSVDLTLYLLTILRLLNPNALIPATTALGTLQTDGRERGILSGANVIMPNLSPVATRKKYMLYNGKLASGEEAAEGLLKLKESMKKIGYEIVTDRGDFSK
ncbi:MAG: [FeFe] hydrogenase H-cluster radical SAM maturase HydE [Clostridia bacterium]|nr:[FeFe] hydrogenase H-cluster radical SAM maturase HydE [Clostridia bacterium]